MANSLYSEGEAACPMVFKRLNIEYPTYMIFFL